jgi:hypothetical protein
VVLAVAVLLAGCGAPPGPLLCVVTDEAARLALTPPSLEASGLYADFAQKTLAEGVTPFAPRYELWSDGAEKSRFVRLPAGKQVDTSDMDHWSMPEGASFWKEFRLGGRRVETRLIRRVGPCADDFVFAAYLWDAAEAGTLWVPEGSVDAGGSGHQVPSLEACLFCHGESRDRVLGFSAVQLSDAYRPPGSAEDQAVLGYLHANCGTCHNPHGVSFDRPLNLRLSVHEDALAATGVWRTAVNVEVEVPSTAGRPWRIRAGEPGLSDLLFRVGARRSAGAGEDDPMPPLGTEQVHGPFLEQLEAWISGLPR